MSRFPVAVFWFLFMGGWGAAFPFLGLYFRENAGLTGTEVGMVLGALRLVGLVAQPLWGQISDRTGSLLARAGPRVPRGPGGGRSARGWRQPAPALRALSRM